MNQSKLIDSKELLELVSEYEAHQLQANILQERIVIEFFKNRNLNLGIDYDGVGNRAIAFDCESVSENGGLPADISLDENAVIDFINVSNSTEYKNALKKHQLTD